MGEGNIFTLCVSPHLDGGGVPCQGLDNRGVPCPGLDGEGGTPSQVERGTSSQVWVGGTPSQVWMGGYPIPGLDGGRVPGVPLQPGLDGGGYPGQVCMVGVPQLGLDGKGVPHLRSRGVPHPRSGWGYTHHRSGRGGTPSQVWMVGVPQPGLDGGGGTLIRSGWDTWVAPSMTGWGTPHHDWMGTPP